MRWTTRLMVLLLLLSLFGCGNVYLSGQALTATETSAQHALEAYERSLQTFENAPEGTLEQADWIPIYLEENYLQWRAFVRSAKKDPNWGKALQGEK